MLSSRTMEELTPEETQELLIDLVQRNGTAAEIASWYSMSKADLSTFVEAHRAQLEALRERPYAIPETPDVDPTPIDLGELWITNKTERIRRAQECAEILFKAIKASQFEGAELATALREFRSYSMWVANELGQLLHRGAGDAGTGDSLAIDIEGVDMSTMR